MRISDWSSDVCSSDLPRTDEIGRSSDWVEHCNQLGRAAIDAATKDGLISHVDGAAFGMAAQFARALPANASPAARSLSRDFPLVVMAPNDSDSHFPST